MLVQTRHLGKRFMRGREPFWALRDAHITLPKGKVIGLLGPNGAGKTTLIRLLTRIWTPDTGEIFFLGQPLEKVPFHRIGYMPEERGLYPKIPVEEQLVYLLQFRGLSTRQARAEVQSWLNRLEAPFAHLKPRQLSKGMQQKIQFVLAVAGNPDLLILDEPFSGLDPINTELLETILTQLRAEGKTILLSTHRLEQADTLCEYVVLINKGQIVLQGDVENLRREAPTVRYEVEVQSPVASLTWPSQVKVNPKSAHIAEVVLSASFSPKDLLQALLPQTEVIAFAPKWPTLREIFLHQVKETPPTLPTT
ncbi:MAG: ABC transporter ATP-binding protein [Bacteroidia bacterium]